MYGFDRDGNVFPPQLSSELCKDFWKDHNKQCLREAMIKPSGPLNASTVTISPWNHFGVRLDTNESKLSLSVPAPKILCMVYTIKNSHSTRIRAIRETWGGGCDVKEKHEKKTNRVAKLHENCTKTLLFVAASDDSTIETEIADSAKAFFNAKSAEKAEQELSNQFSKLKMKKVAFSSGTSKSLYKGQLFWDTDTSPMNLSVFMFWKPGCSEPSMNGRFLVLHSLEKSGKVVSAEEVKKALKQGIVVPQSYHGMFEQMECHKTALQIFCGKSGHLPTKYIKLLDSVKELQDKFEEGQAPNPQFMVGFMYLVDVHVHEFLKS